MTQKTVIIIGGGGTSAALAHDLSLRGVKVTVVERGEVTSGTTGRHHGLLHSGGRYAVKDQESAKECIEENQILRKIAPGSFEENDGLFIAYSEKDLEYYPKFMDGCKTCGIPTEELTKEQALRLEPNLTDNLIKAVRVPDASFDGMRLVLRFFATAKKNGTTIKTFHEVKSLIKENNTITGVVVRDHTTEKDETLHADLIINAAGPWSGRIANMADVNVPIKPSPGILLSLNGRLCNMVINHLAPSGDGDILVPQRALTVIGTSSWVVENPDNLGLPKDHIQKMYEEGAKMIPLVNKTPFRAAWAGARPLIGSTGATTGRELSRTFKAFDHSDEGTEGFITITGGKATTLRAMAEAAANLAVKKLDIEATCQTREVELLPHNAYYEY